MISRETLITCDIQYLKYRVQDIDHCAFFDIETTGFRAGTSHLYLIGVACHQPGEPEDQWHIFQWMAQRPQEEVTLLRAFSGFLKQYRTLLHFNGKRFDVPYLEEKYLQYQIPSPFTGMESVDLYQDFRCLKSFLKLEHMNQKSLERFLGLDREDKYDGGMLIPVYREYCKNGSETNLRLLLLHNAEDMSGMFTLTSLYGFVSFMQCNILKPSAERTSSPAASVIQMREDNSSIIRSVMTENSSCSCNSLLISFKLNLPVPVPFSASTSYGYLILRGNAGKYMIPFLEDTLYYYFSDYKNYYYLPQEDQAIHKSVATYVNKEYRQPAKAENCYIKKEGIFLPQPGECFSPAFRRHYKDAIHWFAPEEGFLDNEAMLLKYLGALIRS